MSARTRRGAVAATAVAALVACGSVALLPPAAHAASPILPGNEGDVGVYTDGLTDSLDIGDPVYRNLDTVEAALDPGVPYTADSMYQSIFDADVDAGGTDFYLDRVLGVSGTAGNSVLQTRGRTLYLRGASSWNTMGFAGNAFAGGPNNLGDLYTITVPGQTVSEEGSARFNAPSHAKARYSIGSTGVTADLRKLITHDNTALSALTFTNPGSSDVTFTVRAQSPVARSAADADDELTGTRTLTSGANNGLVDTPWSSVTVGLKADGFTRSGSALDREVTVPAGGSVDLSVVGGLYSDALPDGEAQLRDLASMEPGAAFRTGVTAFNERWAADIPYIDVPDPAIEKAIVYRWWGERYNSLDANEPGYVYQYPTTIEGVHLYQNSVVLTQPMHLQDTKWIRNPYLAYGQVLNVGELSGSSALLDSPGHTSWNNHYSQYLGTAGLEAYNVHGGGPDVAERFAHYFEQDGVGQLEHYDGNDDGLIAYDTNYMPGNDSDAITFGYPKANAGAPGARTIERPESAYVWGAFDAASKLYEIAGADPAKVSGTAAEADRIQQAVLDRLWSEETQMFLAGTSHGATSAAASGGSANPLPEAERDLIPAKESNLYDVYAQNLVPAAEWEKYVDGFRFLRYGDNFPIFPFYTANQYDRSKFDIGGSNNFSNINFTVQYRGVRAALRDYDPEQRYITPEYAATLLDWMAWSIYPNGDARVANQAEYYSGWNAETKTYNRNNPNHVMLGNMSYIFVEDMGGIQPRSDDLIELSPIDLGYDHFMVNNLRYHGHDVSIVWDPDGTHYGLGAGYSLFVDGERKASADTIGGFVYDPAANEVVEADDGIGAVVVADQGTDLPAAVDTPIEDERVVSYLKTAGIDLTEESANLAAGAALSSSATQDGARPTPWRTFHTPGFSSSSMNYTPGAITTTERPVSLDAVTDGVTVNEPYWGNHGTDGDTGYVELDLGEPVALDNVKVWFVSDRQEGGYAQPQRYSIQVPDGQGGWTAVPEQAKAPKVPGPKLNEALFPTTTTDRVRVAFTNAPGHWTAISEIQAFDSGRPVPPVVNDPPAVSATFDDSADGNLSTQLVATATDDGLPDDGELTYGWETVSAPDGAGVIFADDAALTTRVTGTAPGEYVFRFRATDGELTTTRDVTVTLEERETTAEFGRLATITTSGASPWENPQRVNAESTPASSSPGAGNGWGTWGQAQNGTSQAQAAWIQYAWSAPVQVSSTDIFWYDDTGGTRTPRADTYAVEYTTDGETWSPVTLADGESYGDALARNDYNRIAFEPVEASALRVRIWGVQPGGAGTGVLRWRVNGDTVDTVASPVVMRTTSGVVPELPAQLDVVYSGGSRGTLPFTWQEITPAMVAEPNVEPFVVHGTNAEYGLLAEARVYVRPETAQDGIAIQGAETFEREVQVGEQPHLPTRVAVSYNDGSRDNQAIGVVWDFDESVVQEPGVHVITGQLVLPDYVSEAGTTQTTLTLTVLGDPDAGPVVTATAEPRCLAGRVTLAVRAVNDEDGPLDVTLATAFGTKEVSGVQPGAAAYQSFATRTGSVEAGTATVTADDGAGRTSETSIDYPALTCG
ncbi:discoidin domain-containing protein [Promicromonospora vindobonensis]|uniref:Discoidin domain-containing protein n=1 Tax=Promicromonospora vindobonensis TaxID=195748 RepID=A0ABW5W1R2_9MICO